MQKQVVSTLEVPSPGVGAPPAVGAYSLGVVGAGLVFVSGQGGIQPDGVIVDGIEAQTELRSPTSTRSSGLAETHLTESFGLESSSLISPSGGRSKCSNGCSRSRIPPVSRSRLCSPKA